MNKYFYLFKFEFKRRMPGMIIWTVVWIIFNWLLLLFFDSLVENITDLKNLMDRMPQGFLNSLGVDIDTITTIEGFVNSRLTLLSLIIGGIWIGSIGAQMIGKDENTGSLTWLITQPVSRIHIFILKLLSISIWIIIVNFLIAVGIITGIFALTSVQNFSIIFFFELGLGLSAFYLLIVSIGNLGAILWDEDKGKNLAIFIVILNFVMNIIRVFEDAPGFVKYLTSYYYFNPDELIKTNTLSPRILVLFIGFIIFSIIGALKFSKRDIKRP